MPFSREALRTRIGRGRCIEVVHHLVEVAFEQVCVRVQGDGHPPMTELLLDDLDIRARGSYERFAGVPLVVVVPTTPLS